MKQPTLVFLAALVILISGCSQQSQQFVVGQVYHLYTPYYLYDRVLIQVLGDPVTESVSVKVNGENIAEAYYMLDVSYSYYFDDFDTLTPGGEYRLEVETNASDASAICRLPGIFNITYPADSIVAVRGAISNNLDKVGVC